MNPSTNGWSEATGDGEVYWPSPDPDDHRLAHVLAESAGARLLELRDRFGGDQLRGQGDRRANEWLLDRLSERRPADAVLSEESLDDPNRSAADRVWIIDPLDGTREYAEPGRVDWAVHVALWADGRLVAGAVGVPATGSVVSTWRPAVLGAAPRAPVVLVSRTRPPELIEDLTAIWPARRVPMGSAGAKTVAVLAGRATAYVHAGGQYEWDSAAPVAVALASGCRVRRLDGSPPRYNKSDPALPDIVICHPAAAPPLWAALDSLRDGPPASRPGP